MAETKQVRTIPDGRHTVTPFVIARGADRFMDFMVAAFDAEDLGRFRIEGGKIGHGEVRIGDSVVMTFDAKEGWPETPAFLRLYIDDCDATFRKALESGATSVTEPGDMPWGDRVGRVRDPLGNLWWLMTHMEDVSPEEEGRRYGVSPWMDALAAAQAAEFFPRND